MASNTISDESRRFTVHHPIAQDGNLYGSSARPVLAQVREIQVSRYGVGTPRQREIDSCFVLKNDYPITEDGEFRRLP
jgi:hypothetical protein